MIVAKRAAISSLSNPLLKDVRKAIMRGDLTSSGWAVAETFHLLEEARRSGLEIPVVLSTGQVQQELISRENGLPGSRLIVLPDAIFRRLASTENAQGVIALVRLPAWNLEDVFGAAPLVVVLDGVQDPGNAGAILRAGEAFGATGAVFLKGSVSPFNVKTIRASAGSLFRLPFVAGIEVDAVQACLRKHQVSVYAAHPRGNLPLTRASFRAPTAIVIGSEGHGVRDVFLREATLLSIPTMIVESLNAAQAATVVLYEAARQRGVP
ncbi:MAG TPA: RNA methyltransferase [Bryobacterales bacterium]|nr:RNA methyltransferase [Bryobacterales bacterium]